MAALWIPPTLAMGIVVLGERHWPRPEGAIRTAIIGPPRSWASLLPRFSTAVAVLAVLAAGASLWPWTGPDLVAAVGLVILWVVAGVAVRDVYRRPSLPGILPVGDTILRQVAVGRIMRLAALGGLITAIAALVSGDGSPGWLRYTCWILVAAMIIGWRRPRRRDLAVVSPSSSASVSQL